MRPRSSSSKASSNLLAEVLEFMPTGIVVIDGTGKIVLINRETQRLFQYQADELIGQQVEILLPQRFRDTHPQLREAFFTDPQARKMGVGRELFGLRKDGNEFPVEIGLSPLKTKEGTFVLGSIVDISERFQTAELLARAQRVATKNLARQAKSARRRAEETEERLNLALKSSEVGTWTWDVNENSIIWDDYIHPLFGLKPGTFPGKYEDFLQILHPDDRKRVSEAVARAINENTPFDTEYQVVWPDGSVHVLGARGKVYRDSDGRPLRMAGVCWDITDRIRLEERVRAAVEAAPAAMMMANADGEIVMVNHKLEELFGYPRSELIGQKVEFLMPERFRTGHPSLRNEYFENPVQRDMGAGCDIFGVRKNGTEFPVKIGLSPIETAEGRSVICGVMDLTAQKKALEVLRQAKNAAEAASRAKSSFLANMSHEIRTPMNGIIGMTQLLSQTELQSHQRDYLATIDESAHVLMRLLNDILDFSKIEAGKLELECVEFRVSECVARASQMLALRAAEKGLEIACRVAPEIPDNLQGDPGRLQQVLVNLLGNAVKFTDAGEIFVNVDADILEDDRVQLSFSVSDTGIGISPDKQEQIFRPFEQAESSTTRRFGGTGLGLTISRQLVDMMHGKMWVESEPGRGSTFHFFARFGVAADQHLHEPAELDSLSNLPVLVVDDNYTNRRILGELLQYWRMQAVLVDSADAARNAMRIADESNHPIRLVLLDHHMPGEDGLHFAESIRREPTHPVCPIIMISSGSAVIDLGMCQKYGICRFMTKPVIASELLNEILRQFGRYTTIKTTQRLSDSTATPPQPRRVLLVEDNEINRRVALGMLNLRGHQVATAENGLVAIETLADQEFDVVLMDMQMPIMDGYEATAAIRKREHQTGGHIPIIAMTAEALKGDRERCLASGMDDYVSKPIAPAELYRAIEQFPALCLTSHPDLSSVSVRPVSDDVNGGIEDSNERPAIDWNIAKKLLGDGPQVLRDFTELIKTQLPELLADIHRGVDTGNHKLLRRAAHTMKGSVAYLGAEPLVQAALALENQARAESVEGVAELRATLDQEFARFLAALDAGVSETVS